MSEKAKRSNRLAVSTTSGASLRYGLVVILGLAFGTAAFAGYQFWAQRKAQQTMQMAQGDPGLAKPSAAECAVARAALAAIHAAGDDARWSAAAGASAMSLRGRSQVINAADTPGFTDAEEDDLRAKAPADWRWCARVGTFIHALGWSPVDPDEGIAALVLGRPGMSAAVDEAKLFEAYIAPQSDGALLTMRGPWLVTLRLGPDKTWRVTNRTDLPR